MKRIFRGVSKKISKSQVSNPSSSDVDWGNCFLLWDHSFSKYENLSEKLAFITNVNFLGNFWKIFEKMSDFWKIMILLRLQPATLLKVSLFHGSFSRLLYCANGSKSRNAYHLILPEIWKPFLHSKISLTASKASG